MFFLLLASAYAAIYGVDYSTLTSVSSHQCFINNGFTFAIPRCWCSVGSMDSNCAQSVLNAYDGGMSRVDAYFFPCYSCGNVAGQVSTFWNQATAAGIWVTRIWFDVEGTWLSSYSTNQAFLMEMMNQARSIGMVHGIYCSYYYWTSFFGSYTYPYYYDTQVWYAHYDGLASFSDYSAFGGWSTPNIKQYLGNQNYCSAYVDFNYEA